MSTAIEVGKKMIRAQVAADLAEKLASLREERPELDYQQAWQALEAQEPALFRYAAKVESDQWPQAKPEPVFRYIPWAAAKAPGKSLREAAGLPELVKAKKPASRKDDGDDSEVMLVYAADGSVAGLELHKKTQALIDRTDGPLHRDVARHLVLDQNPQLAGEHEDREKLLAAQLEIKRRIAEMRLRDPSKSFRQCWESLQRSDPQLFAELP